MTGINLKFNINLKKHWLKLTFFDLDVDRKWFLLHLGSISFNKCKSLNYDSHQYNLLYFHNSIFLTRFDIFFIKLYINYKSQNEFTK